MDLYLNKYWSTFWSVLVVIVTCQLVVAQDDAKATAKLPPLINADIPDQVWFQADNDEFKFTLDCKAEGSEPIEYKWEKVSYDDAGVRTVVKDYAEDAADVSILISKLLVELPQATHEGLYQCMAKNDYGSAVSKVIAVKRIIWKRPKKGADVIQNEASQGDFFQIKCDDSTSFPKSSFSWALKGPAIKGYTPVQTSQRVVVAGDGSLIFANVQMEDKQDGNSYQCEQRNPKNDIKAGGKYNSLAVVEAPEPHTHAPKLRYVTELEGDTIVLGEHVRVQCVFSGNPTPHVHWTFRPQDGPDDEPVPEVLTHPGKQDNLDHTTLSHTLGKRLGEDEMAPPNEGTLKCTGSNSEGDEEHEIPVKIEYPPRLAASPSVRRVEVGEEVIFSCGADGNPKPDVQFLINGEVAEGNDRRSIEEMTMDWDPYRKENSVLLVMTIPETCINTDENQCDEGEDIFSIQCFARNKHGSAMGSGFLSVYDPEVESADDVDLDALGDGDNDDEDREDEDSCTDQGVLTSIDKCKDSYQDEVDTEGLCLAYCNYHVCIGELNLDCEPPSIGDREFCNGLCIEKGLMADPDAPEKEKKYKGLSKKVITTICVVILILIILLLLFVIYKIYKKRQQRKKYKGVSTVYKPTTTDEA